MMDYFNEQVRWIRRYLAGVITEEEQRELDRWIGESEENRLFFEEMRRDTRFASEYPVFRRVDHGRAWRRFEVRIGRNKRFTRKNVLRYAAVIVFPVAVLFAMWLLYDQEGVGEVKHARELVQPGGFGATLVLNDGTRFAMKEGVGDRIAVGEGVMANRKAGELVYDSAVVDVLRFNTLQVPRGGEFKLTLSDGTRVCLNSATDLRYPVVFNEKERKVYLSGEAYFEVAEDKKRPFYVVTNDVQVRVYGTIFNVNTSKKGEVETVLVRGEVGVKGKNDQQEYILKPGQLARFGKQAGTMEVRDVDTYLYTAWVEGVFTFEEKTLEEIMHTLSLWYNVDVFFQSEEVKRLHFSGHLKRYEEIHDILDAITEVTGAVFSVKERTIIISR